MTFDKVILINLKRREDRLEKAVEELMKTNWNYEVFEAYDGKYMTIPSWFKASPGAFGCLQTHLAIYNSLVKKSFESCLILEDDFILADNAIQTIENTPFPGQWTMIYLGGQPLVRLKDYIQGLSRCSQIDRTHAYVINQRFLKKIYPRLEEQPGFHIDTKLRALQDDQTFIFSPQVIGQRAGYSDVLCGYSATKRFWNVFN
jgi:hypothetical protein